MGKREKRKFSNDKLQQCWSLWRQGLGYNDIARELNSKPGTIFGVVRIHGVYAPPKRSRHARQLSLSEREEISRGLAQNLSVRAIPGHWEGDLISGSKNSHIATLVERSSRYTILANLEGKDTESVVQALIREMTKLPLHLRKTLTWDRGMEMAKHQDFTIATDMEVYFCDPISPWQRGTNENTNRLLRQYFPKKTPLGHFAQDDLDEVALELNERPRKTLEYRTPFEVILEGVAMTN